MKPSGDSLIQSKRFRVITGSGGIAIALQLIPVLLPHMEDMLPYSDMIVNIVVPLGVTLAVMYGIQDIIGTIGEVIAKNRRSSETQE